MDRIDEIRARLDAATPGPWRRADHTKCCNSVNSVEDESGRVMAEVWSPRMDYDADLIAHAPADIAWLLDEVERLQEIENNQKRMSEMLREMLDERCEDN